MYPFSCVLWAINPKQLLTLLENLNVKYLLKNFRPYTSVHVVTYGEEDRQMAGSGEL